MSCRPPIYYYIGHLTPLQRARSRPYYSFLYLERNLASVDREAKSAWIWNEAVTLLLDPLASVEYCAVRHATAFNDDDCNDAMSAVHRLEELPDNVDASSVCRRCRGWAHGSREWCSYCPWCVERGLCSTCASKVLVDCETSNLVFCRACQRSWNIIGDMCLRCFENQSTN
jgi:hypothetical protein